MFIFMCMKVALICPLFSWFSRPSVYSCVRVNTLQTTTKEVIKQLTRYVLQQQNDNQSRMLKQTEFQEKSSEAGDPHCAEKADVTGTKLSRIQVGGTISAESTSEEDEGSESCGICFQHDVLDNVVMVKGKGPCSIDYTTVRGEGGVLKEVVVSRKCAEAVLRGAHVCRIYDTHK